MKKFSAGYVPINPNFVITEVSQVRKIDSELAGIIAILKNILLRGCPTIPSVNLKQQTLFGEVKKRSGKQGYCYTNSQIVVSNKSSGPRSFSHSLDQNELTPQELNYLFAIRIQLVLIHLLEVGKISFADENWKFNIKTAQSVSRDVFKAAILDLEKWFKDLYALQNKEVAFPPKYLDLNTAEVKANYIQIDIDVYKLAEDIKDNDVVVFVRNDQQKYPVKTKNQFPEKEYQNYYRVYMNDFRFEPIDIQNKRQVGALNSLFLNLFGQNIKNFNGFRPKQLEIITEALNPKNAVIGILPTGSGKSVCFQFVSFLTPGITVVVSPLKNLMADQVENLFLRNWISTADYLNSSNKRDATNAFAGCYTKILYLSPERFFDNEFRELFKEYASKIGQIVIDEVHCLSEWGHDFRTSYLLLFGFFKDVGLKDNVILMGTTATSAMRVTQDIQNEFAKLNKNSIVEKAMSIKRKELTFSVKKIAESPNLWLADRIKEYAKKQEKSVVFIPYSREAQELARVMKQNLKDEQQVRLDFFVGNSAQEQDEEDKKEAKFEEQTLLTNEEKCTQFKSGKLNTLFATKAFGMGMDIPDIRHCIHFEMAASIESMWQEMGRAGRDGMSSLCETIIPAGEGYEDLNILYHKYKNNFDGLAEFAKDKSNQKVFSKQLSLIANSNSEAIWESYFVLKVYEFLKNQVEDFSIYYAYNEIVVNLEKKDRFYKWKISPEFKKWEKDPIHYDGIKPDKWMRVPDYSKFEMFFDKALYKLYLLKIVSLWSQSYRRNQETNRTEKWYDEIPLNEIEPSIIKENLGNYIHSYEPEYKIKTDFRTKTLVKDAIDELCQWCFEKFFVSRWNSLATLNEYLFNFEDSDKFASKIEDYFSDNAVLDNAIRNPRRAKFWFEVLKKSRSRKEELQAQINKRRADGINNNLALDFIAGILAIQLGDFFGKAEEIILENVFKRLEVNDNFKKMLKNIFDILNKDEWLIFLAFLQDHFPSYLNFQVCRDKLNYMFPQDREKLEERALFKKLLPSMNKLSASLNKFRI